MPPSEPRALERALDDLFVDVNRSDAPGLIVGIAREGQLVYRRGFGLASVQHGVANSPGTRMRIASTSKHFTCLAALLLAEEGLLDLDVPVSSYMPGLRLPEHAPTLRQFMNHTSGWRCTLDMGTLANGLAQQPSDWQLERLLDQRDTNFAPGKAQMYSNGTYHALSLVIEKAAGMPFEEVLRTRIFEPLGMRDTESVPDDLRMVPRMATAHFPARGGGWARAAADTELRGDGGMVSTVDDMLAWLAHLRGVKRIGSAATWDAMLTPACLDDCTPTTYALGLKRHHYRGIEVVHHSGGLFGLNCQMLTAPAQALDVVVLVNGAPVSATARARQVLDLLLAEEFSEPPRRLAEIAGLEGLVGQRYRGPGGLLIGFERCGEKLGLSLQELPAQPLLYDEGETLRAGFEEIGLGPYVLRKAALCELTATQAPERLPMTVCGGEVMLERLSALVPEVTGIDGHLGHYVSDDLHAQATLVRDGQRVELLMKGDYSGLRPLDMTPLSGAHWRIAERGDSTTRYPLEFGCHDGRDGFWIDTLRARRLWFKRVDAT